MMITAATELDVVGQPVAVRVLGCAVRPEDALLAAGEPITVGITVANRIWISLSPWKSNCRIKSSVR